MDILDMYEAPDLSSVRRSMGGASSTASKKTSFVVSTVSLRKSLGGAVGAAASILGGSSAEFAENAFCTMAGGREAECSRAAVGAS